MSVVGVDFGYQNSVIAVAGRGGVDVILNGNSNRLNPSMVGFDQSRKIGEHALSGVSSNYKNTVTAIKRLIGLSFDDPVAKAEMKLHPLKFVPIPHAGGGSSVGVEVTFNNEKTTVPMEAVAGMMVKHMGMVAAEKAAAGSAEIKTAEQLFPQDWVVTIPNYYTDAQRRALLAGCEIAGISVQRLMHEGTATALAYGIFKDLKKVFTKDKPTHVMFIDMGASAYTVSIAAFEPGKLTIKTAYSDSHLGGRDFDRVIATWVAGKFQEKYKNKLSAPPLDMPKTRLKLMTAAEKAKKTLSPHGVKEARLNLEMLQDDLDFNISLKADEYEEICAPLLARLAAPIQAALADAKLTAKDLDSIEIVGGSTRIGCVKRKLIEILDGATLSTTMNADEAIARGAALQSAILSPRFKVLPYEIQEAQPYPIKVSWAGEVGASAEATDSVVMFERGLNFPIVRRVTLKRAGNFGVNVLYDSSVATQYGLDAVTGSTSEICHFEIAATAGDEKKVRVNVKQDIHGIVHLSSAQMVEEIEGEETDAADEEMDEEDKKKKKIKKTNLQFTVKRPLDWTKDEIQKANEVEVSMSNTDRIVRETADMRNELESYIYDMRDKVSSESQLGKYGTEEEKSAFLAAIETMENWLYEDGFDASKSVYAEKLSELKKMGNPIESRSYEASNRQAAISALQNQLSFYQNWVNSDAQNQSKYSHLSVEDLETVRSTCDTISSWMYDKMDQQGSKPLNEDPVVTVSDYSAKLQELNTVCGVIMHKPAPPKEPTPPPAAKKEEEAKEEPMETEPPAAEDGSKMDTTE